MRLPDSVTLAVPVLIRWAVITLISIGVLVLLVRFLYTPQLDSDCFLAMDKLTGTNIGGYDDRVHICTRIYRLFGI